MGKMTRIEIRCPECYNEIIISILPDVIRGLCCGCREVQYFDKTEHNARLYERYVPFTMLDI